MNKKKEITIEELISKCESYITNKKDLDEIKRAYFYAEEKHKGQYRLSGEEYIHHVLHTAYNLTTVHADANSIIAGLLHDVLEDCDIEYDELKEEFNKEIADLVYGVTKLGRINFSTENEYLIEYYKKIIVGISEDVRIIIIKLADRLHNMRTLYAHSEAKQKKIAKETLEIFAPIAHHLGIYKIKSELEDLALRYTKPDIFYDIVEKLNVTKVERDKVVMNMRLDVVELLNSHGIKHEIKGRAKSIYSIYKKLDKGRKFSNIYDLLALRILVNTEQECYLALGLIHSKYKPIPKRFKDYVAMPKANMYQSLHTTVFGEDGEAFEIQIRTYEMNDVAENGVAAHWAYKEKGSQVAEITNTTEQKLQFFKTIMELNSDQLSSEDFVNSFKDEILSNNIYAYTPKGDIFELPKGATPIDFAYKIHTKVGEQMIGAIVNNNIVPLTYELQNNDIVKINTNKNSTPSKEWINIAKLTTTKNKIRSYFTKNEREITIEKGKFQLEKELRRRKCNVNDFFVGDNFTKLKEELKIESADEVYIGIGNGKYATNAIINIIYKPEVEEKVEIKKAAIKDIDADIIVAGIDNIKVSLANCCNPIPEDEIMGYITKGSGITVHRSHCHNLANNEDRTVSVEWNTLVNKRYPTNLLIKTNTIENKLMDILQVINMNDGPIDESRSLNKGNELIYEVKVLSKSKTDINVIKKELLKLPFVYHVERVIR